MADPVEFTIRRAEARDMPTVGRLGGLLVRQHHRFDPQRFMAPGRGLDEGYAHFLASELEDEDVVIFVAVRGQQIAGYVYAGLEPTSWKELRDAAGFIHDVVVEESQRGHGIASALVDAAADWLEKAGAPRVLLWTADRNPAAQRLFARLGFRRTMIEMTREAGERG